MQLEVHTSTIAVVDDPDREHAWFSIQFRWVRWVPFVSRHGVDLGLGEIVMYAWET